MPTTSKTTIIYSNIFLAFFLFLLFPVCFFISPGYGAAASGDIALHLARQYGLVFGKDIDTLYGPLGILKSRLPIAVNLWVYLLFDVYFLLTGYLVIRSIFRKHFHFGIVLFAFLVISINMTAALNDWFFFFLLFYLFSFLRETAKSRYLLQGAILAIIGLYFRIDTGVFGVLLFLAVITYSFIRKKLSFPFFALWAIFFLMALFVSGWMLHVNLKGYISGGMHLLRDFSEARFEAMPVKETTLFYLAVEIMVSMLYMTGCLVVLAIIRRDVRQKADDIFVGLAIMLAAMIYYKSDFVRWDDGQVFRFFGISGLLITFFYLNGPRDVWRRVPILGCWIVLALCFVGVNMDRAGDRLPVQRLIDLSFLPARVRGIGNYFSGLWSYRAVSAALEHQSGPLADTAIRAAIGKGSADIVPWEVSRIWSDGLRYDPRPTTQSLYAYNSWLDSLNYEKYMSPGAPDFVLLSFAAYDGHFPFFDEGRTKLAIVNRYNAVTELNGELLLRKANRQWLEPAGQETRTVRLNTDIPIEKRDSMLLFSRFLLYYDRAGRMARRLDHPPGLAVTLTLENGSGFTYRTNKSMLEDGMIVNKYVDGEEELQLLMQAQGRLTANIVKINIQPDSASEGFIDSVTMMNTWYTFRKATSQELVADSAGIVELYKRNQPEPFSPQAFASGNFPFKIYEFNTFSSFIRVKISVPASAEGAAPVTYTPVLRSRDHFFRLPQFEATNSGMLSVASKELLPPGDYELGVAQGQEGASGTEKRTVVYSGKHLYLRSEYIVTESGPMKPVSGGNIKSSYNIERAVIWKGLVSIEGWAVLQKKDTAKTTTTIILSSPRRTYRLSTDPQERPDVGARDSFAGFSVQIPESRLIRDHYSVAIEQTTSNGRHVIQFTKQSLDPGMDNDIQIPVPATPPPSTDSILCNVDRFDDQKEFLTIQGWAIRRMSEVPNSRISIVLRSESDSSVYVVPTGIDKRPDLTEHYHNGLDLDNCGFSAEISKEGLPPGRYKIGLWVRPKNGSGVVRYLHFFSVKRPE